MAVPQHHQAPFLPVVDDEAFAQEVMGRYVETPTGIVGPVTGLGYLPPETNDETGQWQLSYATGTGLEKLLARSVIAVRRKPPAEGVGYLASGGTAEVYRLTPANLSTLDVGLPLPEPALSDMSAFTLSRKAFFAGGFSVSGLTHTVVSRIARVDGPASVPVVAEQTAELSPACYGLQAAANLNQQSFLFGGLGTHTRTPGSDASLIPLGGVQRVSTVPGGIVVHRHGQSLAMSRFGLAAAKVTPTPFLGSAPILLAGGQRTGGIVSQRVSRFTEHALVDLGTLLDQPLWGMTGVSLPDAGGYGAFFVGGSGNPYTQTPAESTAVRKLVGETVTTELVALSDQKTVRMAAPVIGTREDGAIRPVAYLASGSPSAPVLKLTTMTTHSGVMVLTVSQLALTTTTQAQDLAGVGLPV